MEVKDIISSGLLELYATGLASSEEAAQVLQWADQHPEVATELAQIQAGLDLYASATSITPDPSVKDKIFARINNDSETAKVVPFTNKPQDATEAKVIPIVSSYWKKVAAAAIVLLAGSAVLNITQYNKNNRITSELDQSRQIVSNMQENSKAMENDLQVVQSKYSQPVSLNALAPTADFSAKVFWMKNTGDVYVDPSTLPAAPQGSQYELWAIVDGKPVNAGIIITTKKGNRYVIQKMKSFGKVEAFAISQEPQSATPATTPTTVLMLGKM